VTQRPRLRLSTIVLDAPDPPALADFYVRLLGWEVEFSEPEWVKLKAPDGATALAFQLEPVYAQPTWPSRPDAQQMMLHLDIQVDDLEAGGAHAVAQGATLAEFQPQDDVRVYLDPAGHPFCLWVASAEQGDTPTDA
jgi:catechol 2,3-dioxygenase-like lactoylglutathione lyase family enzyme